MSDSGSDSELDLLDDLQGLQAELAALRAELGDDYVAVSGSAAGSCVKMPACAGAAWAVCGRVHPARFVRPPAARCMSRHCVSTLLTCAPLASISTLCRHCCSCLQYQGGEDDSDAEDAGLPGAALASLPATASAPTQPSSEQQQTEDAATEARWEGRREGSTKGRRAAAPSEEEDQGEEEEAEEDEEEEEEGEDQRQRSQQPAAASAMVQEEQPEEEEEEDEHEQAAQMIGRAFAPSLRRSFRSTLHSQQTAQPPAQARQQEPQASKSPAKQQRKRKTGQAAAPSPAGRRARGKKGAVTEETSTARPAAAARAAAAAAAAAAQAQQQQPASKLQAVRAALEANRDLQARLHRLLTSTNRAIDCNANVLLRVRRDRQDATLQQLEACVGRYLRSRQRLAAGHPTPPHASLPATFCPSSTLPRLASTGACLGSQEDCTPHGGHSTPDFRVGAAAGASWQQLVLGRQLSSRGCCWWVCWRAAAQPGCRGAAAAVPAPALQVNGFCGLPLAWAMFPVLQACAVAWLVGDTGQSRAVHLPVLPAPRATNACFRLAPRARSFRNSRWSEEEQQKLRDGVVQLVQVCERGRVMWLGWQNSIPIGPPHS